jgi:hypothetical protein
MYSSIALYAESVNLTNTNDLFCLEFSDDFNPYCSPASKVAISVLLKPGFRRGGDDFLGGERLVRSKWYSNMLQMAPRVTDLNPQSPCAKRRRMYQIKKM